MTRPPRRGPAALPVPRLRAVMPEEPPTEPTPAPAAKRRRARPDEGTAAKPRKRRAKFVF